MNKRIGILREDKLILEVNIYIPLMKNLRYQRISSTVLMIKGIYIYIYIF